MQSIPVTNYAWLSIGAAVATITLKSLAYVATGSVGLLSDAIESLANLFTAITALFILRIALRPADENHAYGHTKAEYFSAVVEGIFIILAAGGIAFTAVDRMLHLQSIKEPLTGIWISAFASLINFSVAMVLFRAAKKHRSITLESDAHHLLTDVWTSVAVIIGIFFVYITNIQILDPIIGILVSLNIVFTGFRIIRQSIAGFMDPSIDEADIAQIRRILDGYCSGGITYHGLRTRLSASRRFVTFHVLVPGSWTVRKGHNLLEKIEKKLHDTFEKMTVTTHLEPIEDPRSNKDIAIDRE